jgi:hypothetical protein
VCAAGQHRFDPARVNGVNDLFAVGGDNYAIDISRGERAFRDPADHRFSGDLDKGFSWQTRRTVTSGNNGDCSVFGSLLRNVARVIHGVTD